MLHIVTMRFEICIDIDCEIREVDLYTWISTSTVFRLASEITGLLNNCFFLQMAYESLSQSRKLIHGSGGPIKSGGLENVLKEISGERLLGTRE